MSNSREIKKYDVKILSELTHEKLLAENVVIVFPAYEPHNQYYEIGKYYKLKLVQINGEWKFIKYYGDVSYMHDKQN